jgi:hypothetical protein
VRLKPWLIVASVLLLSPLRGGAAEARNALRALGSARRLDGRRGKPGRVEPGVRP